MAKKKSPAAKAAKAAAKQAEADAKKALGGKKNATVAHVEDANGRIRTYSKEVHGADFAVLAAEFAGKAEGRTVVAE